ncbi:MAG TPA: transglycosylase domain-containing protein, partial [Anaerolineae bacterium]
APGLTAGQTPYHPAAAQAPRTPAQPRPSVPPGSQRPADPGASPRPTTARPGGSAVGTPGRRRPGCGGVLGLGLFAVALAFLVFGGLLFGYVAIASGLPSPEDLQARASQFASTQIFDRQGQILNEIADPNHGRRTAVALNQISKNLINATIATEDPNFYTHPGVDPVGLARAVYYAVRDRDISAGPGGSTITQQLVKLVYLSSEKSVTRKIKEAVLAAEITRRYSKDTVLQIYLNEIYYGNLAYGIEAASETYFGKHASDLDLAQAAMLAGLPQAPAYYDPYTKLWTAGSQPGIVKQRQSAVLRLMVEHGYITAEQADAAWQEPLTLRPLQQQATLRAPHFVYYVRDDVEKVLGPAFLAKGGLRVYTTLDPKIQGIAEEEVAKQDKALNARGATDGALVAVRPNTGEILAMVGSADFNNDKIGGQINMAISPRQPGSSIKPLTYLTAFSLPATKIDDKTQISDHVSAIEPDGYWTPATAILDITTQFPDGAGRPPYVPRNYDNKEHNIVSVRSALANSYNIPAVKTLQHIGLDRLKDTAARMGITTLTRNDYGLSLTLGGGEVTLLEMTGAYATLATGGSRMPTSPIACVIDANNQVIWRGTAADQVQGCKSAPQPTMPLLVSPQTAKQVVDAQSTYLITSILSDLEARRPAFGNAASLLSLADRPAAAKTGTTNDNRDAWTLGYTPDLAVGVWVGNADYKPMQDVAGSIGAAPIWQNVMRRALEGAPAKQFPVPQGIQRVKVCADSGTLPSEACPAQKEELFTADRGPLPARFDLHQRLRVDKGTGQLATDFTPADRVETKDFLIFPPRYQDWANKHGYPQPNLTAHQYAFVPELAITGPAANSRVTGAVRVTAHIKLPQPLVWRLEYGVGPNPVGWGVLSGPKQGDLDGAAGDFDSHQKMNEHQTNVFSLRLAAYEPGNLDYPAAVSGNVVVVVDIPTPVPSPTALPSATPTATRTPTPTPAATATPLATPTVAPTSTAAVPARSTATATPTTPPVADTLHAAISQPVTGAQVSGRVAVMGDAYGPGFNGFQLVYAPGTNPAPGDYQAVAPVQTQPSTASGGLLGFWQTQGLTPGPYTLRVIVADTRGTTYTAAVQVQVVAAPNKP